MIKVNKNEIREIVIEYRILFNGLCEVIKVDNKSLYNEDSECCLLITNEKRMKKIMYERFTEEQARNFDKIYKLKFKKFN